MTTKITLELTEARLISATSEAIHCTPEELQAYIAVLGANPSPEDAMLLLALAKTERALAKGAKVSYLVLKITA